MSSSLLDFLLEPLRDHDCSQFDSGEPSLNKWLINEGKAAQAAGASRTHVWTAPSDARVLAYFTLVPHTLRPDDLSNSMRGGINGEVPGYLLAKLALDQSLRGRNPRLGPVLLVDALDQILLASDAVGGRVIAVDALNSRAHSFYVGQGFTPLKGDSMRLVSKVSTVRKELRS